MLQKTINKTIEKEYTCTFILMLCNAKTEVKPMTLYIAFVIAQ